MLPGWFLILLSFLFPAVLLWMRERPRFSILKRVNPVIACYIVGIVLANTGLVGESAAGALDTVQTAAVALSIPLLLFSVDLGKSRSLTGRAGLSLILAAASIVIMVTVAHVLFRGRIENSANVAGMVVGVYTGGTPNLAAISRALSVSQDSYLAIHTADLVMSSVYLLFIITIAKKVVGWILPAYQAPTGLGGEILGPMKADITEKAMKTTAHRNGDEYGELFKRSNLKGLGAALGMALLVGVLGGSVFLLAPESSAFVLTILALTTLSLGASFIPKIRSMTMSYPLGQFLILVFCVSVGALADLKILVSAAPTLFLFVGFCLFGSLLLHILFSRIAKVDGDTLLITSTAAICSPPFVGLTASAIGNRDLIAPGITVGILGHALGNYLGVLVAKGLDFFL